jgi:hypothetical protein
MRRLLVGVVWFVALWVGGLFIGGAVVGAIANATQAQPALNFHDGYANGETAGRAFGARYGGLIMLSALGLSIVGSATGLLPGTGRRASQHQT